MSLQLVWATGSGEPFKGEGSICVTYDSGSAENLIFSGSNIDFQMKSGSEMIIGKEDTGENFYRFGRDGDIAFSKAGSDKETVLRLKNEKLEVKQRDDKDSETKENVISSLSTGSFGVISSSLIPDASEKHNLGSSTLKWHTSYVLTASIGGGTFTSASLAAGGSSVTVDTSLTNGSTNPVTNNAVFDGLATKLDLSGGTMTGLIRPTFSSITTITNNTVDCRRIEVLEIAQKKAWTLTTATPAHPGQQLTIIALTAGTITHTVRASLGIFTFSSGRSLTARAGAAYFFVADTNGVWRSPY